MEKRLQNSYVNLHEKGMLQMGIPFLSSTSTHPCSLHQKMHASLSWRELWLLL